MLTRLLRALTITIVCTLPLAAKADQTLPNFAFMVSEQIKTSLQGCGLGLVDPRQPHFPYQRLNATYAVVNQRTGNLLAYFVQDFGGIANNWRWMNPNGSYAHSIQFSNERLRFVTPYQGNVASSSRFVTSAGVGFNMYCRAVGNVFNRAAFETCVQRDFANVVTNQLCQYAQ